MPLAPRGFSGFGGTVAGTDTAGTIKLAAFFAEIVDTLGEVSEERAKIEITNSNSAAVGGIASAEFVPSDIVTPGDYELTLLHDPQKTPPWGLAETIVITLPKRGTATTAAKKTFQGFLTKHVSSFPLKDKMITKCTLAITGPVTHTAAV